jgi:hypothetical protein
MGEEIKTLWNQCVALPLLLGTRDGVCAPATASLQFYKSAQKQWLSSDFMVLSHQANGRSDRQSATNPTHPLHHIPGAILPFLGLRKAC